MFKKKAPTPAKEADDKLNALMAKREARKQVSAPASPNTQRKQEAFKANLASPGPAPAPGKEETASTSSNLSSKVPSMASLQEADGKHSLTGSLKGCPLTPAVYQTAWEEAQNKPRSRMSRLHSTLTRTIASEQALPPFVDFLTLSKVVNDWNFYRAADKFRRDAQRLQQPERLQRAKAIAEKHLAPTASHPINVDFALQAQLYARITTDPNVTIEEDLFQTASDAALHLLKREYFPHYMHDVLYYRFCLGILSAPDLSFEDIFLNETAMMPFMEFLEKKKASRIVQFWLTVENFADNIRAAGPSANQEELRADARSIYVKYFNPDAGDPLGVDEETRTLVEANISAPGGVTADVFGPAQHLVVTAMRLHFFPMYLKSDLFERYKEEIARKTRVEGERRDLSKKRPVEPEQPGSKESDAAPSSRSSLQLQPSQLPQQQQQQQQHAGSDAGTFDEDEVCKDTDKLGKVNELGIYLHDVNIAENPAFEDLQPQYSFGKKMKVAVNGKRCTQSEITTALQAAKAFLSEVRKEMREHNTLFMYSSDDSSQA